MFMKYLIVLIFVMTSLTGFGQKTFSEGEVHYNISVVSGNNEALAKAFSGATQVVFVKGYQARVDFISQLRTQSTVYDAQSKSGFIMRQSGSEKYLIPLNPAQWLDFNKRYLSVNFTQTNETKEILGYVAQKATAKLGDGSILEVWYVPALPVLAKGYDLAFASLNGLPLEYTVSNGGLVLKYTATQVKNTMVNAAVMEMPKSGYKLLEYQGS